LSSKISSDILKSKLLSNDDLKEVHHNLQTDDLTDLMYATFLHQKLNWPMLSEGWKGYQSGEYKKYIFGWFLIKTQFNPTRFISSSAKVDEDSIKKRKCFLCLKNLPKEQKGILFNNDLIVLCNPAPVFNEHFTISNVDHKPQEILPNVGKMLRVANKLNNEYTVFYNGPKCGASAPDHFHFQACPSDELITEKDLLNNLSKFNLLVKGKDWEIRYIKIDDYLRNTIAIISNNPILIEQIFLEIYEKLKKISGSNDEPMMNIFALQRDKEFYFVIFPREKHRPDFYFAEGEENMLVSPGLVDMCGMLITPLQKDFEKINHNLIKQIYNEVTLDKEKFSYLLDYLQTKKF